jgi:hypothetical protein
LPSNFVTIFPVSISYTEINKQNKK